MTFILNKSGYEPFIDYLKGLCIIFVLIMHCIPKTIHDITLACLWGDMGVSVFLIIQVFHIYKKEVPPKISISKLWKRIVKPFLVMQSVILTILIVGGGTCERLINFLTIGGYGPGSYYTWVYVQFAIIIPLVYRVTEKFGKCSLMLLLIIISSVLEYICSVSFLPDRIYRLLFFRYTFLIYFGIMIVRDGISMNRVKMTLSIIGILFILFFCYIDMNLEPYFYHTGWVMNHWPCYFYVGFLMLWVLRYTYDYMKSYLSCLTAFIEKIGCNSYEIFLFQMFYFFFLDIICKMIHMQDDMMTSALLMLFSPVFCIMIVLSYKNLLECAKSS